MAKQQNVKKRTTTRLVLWGLTGAFLLASAAVAAKIIFPSDGGYRENALKHGQRIEVNMETGEVEGELLALEDLQADKPKTEEANTEEPATPVEEAAETPVAPVEETTEAPAEQPAPAEEQPATSEPAAPQSAVTEPAVTQPTVTEPVAPVAEQPAAPAPTHEAPPLPPIDPVEKRLPDGSIVPTAANGQTAMKFYAKKYTAQSNGPRIAVAVTGLGLSQRVTEAAIALPVNVSLSFSPYGKLTPEWSQAARQKGHELLLDLPAETRNFPAVDPGPDGILVHQDLPESTKRLERVLSRSRGYIGMVMPVGDSLSKDPRILEILSLFAGHGLLMVNAYPQPTEPMFQAGEKTGAAVLHTTIVIDEQANETGIKNQLARAEDLARRYGQVMLIGRAQALTITQLDSWLKSLPQKGITLVPVSAIAPEAPERVVSPYTGEFYGVQPTAAPAPSPSPAAVPADVVTPPGVTIPNEEPEFNHDN
ncbi:MAG: hypothetical protein FJX23_08295 [Alphaproteobacteria bacterium]|nr:hypothetical protein [Alphaproteobacteria bacterium]